MSGRSESGDIDVSVFCVFSCLIVALGFALFLRNPGSCLAARGVLRDAIIRQRRGHCIRSLPKGRQEMRTVFFK